MEVQWPSEDLLASEKPSKNQGFPLVFLCFSYHCKIESWALLGGSWAPLGLYLEGLGRLLSSTWGQPGRRRDHLGRSWGQLGRTLGYLDLPKLLLGCSWRILGASRRPQGAVLAVQSGLSNSARRPKTLRGANSGGLELPQMPIWRRVAFCDSSTWRNLSLIHI